MVKESASSVKRLQALLEAVAKGDKSVASAMSELQVPTGLHATDHATTDLDRLRRRGIPEVVYGEGKTAEQIIEIFQVLLKADQSGLATRVSPDKLAVIESAFSEIKTDAQAGCALVNPKPSAIPTLGRIAVISAGTSDLPIAAETVFCLRAFGNEVEEFRDLGVSGLHRILQSLESFRSAQVVIVIAGFEAALPTVLGGLIDRPIIAVPTSVGYGTSMGGLTALLGMLNSCTPGMTVVNIDNGFGAAYAATQINRMPRSS